MKTSESKGRFFYKTNRFELVRITNRIDSNRESECSSVQCCCNASYMTERKTPSHLYTTAKPSQKVHIRRHKANLKVPGRNVRIAGMSVRQVAGVTQCLVRLVRQ